jgi:hypothetical protein
MKIRFLKILRELHFVRRITERRQDSSLFLTQLNTIIIFSASVRVIPLQTGPNSKLAQGKGVY